MKPLLFLVACLSTLLPGVFGGEPSRVYELRIYHTFPGKFEALQTRFREHTLGLFERHGMENIGYWTPVDGDGETLVYLLGFASRESQKAAWEGFLNDADWKAAYAASIVGGRLVSSIESFNLDATDYSPELVVEKLEPARLFELRRYRTPAGGLGNLDARFREHTLGLFGRHGMENVAYFHLAAGSEGEGETLIYFLAHRDRAARDASFDAFRADAEWLEARRLSEEKAGGSLTAPGGLPPQFLAPTDYSRLR